MIDIGANLTDKSFSDDLHVVLEQAQEAGLSAIVVTGTDVAASQAAQKLAHNFPDALYSTAGVHPHHADEVGENWIEELTELARLPEVVAIGETGLDYFRDFSPREDQKEVFVLQLQLARDLAMPIFIHDRDSHGDMARLLSMHLASPSVVHCFTGNAEALKSYLDLGCYIGITGWVCDERRGSELAGLIPNIPLDRLLIETDAPYLLPRTIRPRPRSRRNEPKYLVYVAQKVAELTSKSIQEIAEVTTQNAKQLFRLP